MTTDRDEEKVQQPAAAPRGRTPRVSPSKGRRRRAQRLDLESMRLRGLKILRGSEVAADLSVSEGRVRQWATRGEWWSQETAQRMGVDVDTLLEYLLNGDPRVRDERGLVGIAATVQQEQDEYAVSFPLIGTRIAEPGSRSTAGRWAFAEPFVRLFKAHRNPAPGGRPRRDATSATEDGSTS
jgi:hypothetical protein